MTDLIAFLTARLDEDEAIARRASHNSPWRTRVHHGLDFVEGDGWTVCQIDERDGNHIARWDPERVLAEIEAKRAIVDAHDRVWITTNWQWVDVGSYKTKKPFPICKSCAPLRQFPEQSWPCPTLHRIAAVYADHPEYDESWKP